MKRIIILFVCLLVGCGVNESYTGTGAVEERAYDLDGINEVVLNHDFKGTLKIGEAFSIKVITNEDVFQYLDIKKEGTVLIADYLEDVVLENTEIRIEIVCPEVTDIVLNNDAQLSFDTITTESLTIKTTSDTILDGRLSVKMLDIISSSDSQVTLSGDAEKIMIIGDNSAKIDLSKVGGKEADIQLFSDAYGIINVTDEIRLTAESSPTLEILSGKLKKISVEEDVVIKEVN